MLRGIPTLEAIKRDGLMLKYASDELNNDRKFVLEAVKERGYALTIIIEFFFGRLNLSMVNDNCHFQKTSSAESQVVDKLIQG